MIWTKIPSYEELEQEIQKTGQEHPEILVEQYGESEDGRKLYSLRIGDREKTLILLGGIHGRETVNPALLLQMAKDTAYLKEQADPVLTGLLEEYSLLFVPLANPDGYEIGRAGFGAIRNPELRRLCEQAGIPWQEWKANGRAVDLNRNFPSVHYQPEKEGDFAGSEKETQALMTLMEKNPDGALVDFHSRGEVIYYYRNAMDRAYNEKQRRIAEYLQEETGYVLGLPEEELPEDGRGGNTVHFYSETMKEPAITIETVPAKAAFPLAFYWLDIVYEQIKNVPILMLEAL